MSDSTRRVLFGNLNINLKIKVNQTIQSKKKINNNLKKFQSKTQNKSINTNNN